VLVYLNVRKTLSRGIPLFLSNRGSVLTTGDQHGVLPPELFHQVLRVSVERETLLQNEAKKKPMGRWQREALNALKYGPRTKGDADTSEQ
jgi:ABC-type cobalamin transport system ATPase subunit